MRILVVSQYFWPENFRINDLVTELTGRGHEVTVLTGYPNYPSGRILPEFRNNPAAYGKYAGADIVRVPLKARGRGSIALIWNYLSFALSACLLGSWRLHGKGFDAILIFQLSPITLALPGVLLRYLKKAPSVLWVFDLWPETLEAIGVVRSPFVLKLVGKLVSFIYNRCDLILGQSRSFIPQIRRYCSADKWVEHLPSWSDALFDFSAVEKAPEVAPGDGVFSIMFAGNMGDAQDFPAILDAAEILKEEKGIRWLIVGDGRVTGWVRSEVDKRGLGESFILLGRYPVDRMPSFYKHADALLVSLKDTPIFAMTIPGKLQSYLAAGIPVLAMLNGEGAEIVRRSGAGLTCAAGDGRALAAAVLEVAGKHRDELLEMGRRGLAVSQAEFDRSTLISRLLGWLDGLVAGNRTRTAVGKQ